MKIVVTWMTVAVIGLAAAALAQPMPLPEPGPVSGPWIERIFLTGNGVSPEEAVRFRVVDDPEAGRALVVGPWLAGAWSARVEYAKDFPPENVNLVGRYRTVDLPHTAPVVRCECFDDQGKRLNEVSYYLPLSPRWKSFSLRFDKFLAGTHCSSALIGFLRDRYQTIEALNRSWETEYADFDRLKADRPEPKLRRGPMYDDFTAFERRIVERFVDVTLQATRDADPNHLIAGNRHNIGGVEVWMKHIDLWAKCDLVALSMYPRHQHPGLGPTMRAILDDVAERTGRPIVFGEWSVPALDSGLYRQTKAKLDWSFPQCVPDQRIRAGQAKLILADFFNHPSVVGAHWFTYSDSDSAKRQANRGLARADGRPWQRLVDELAKLHARIHRAMAASTAR